MTCFLIDISDIKYYSLKNTVLSHGWINLSPNSWDNAQCAYSTIIEIDSVAISLSIKQINNKLLSVQVNKVICDKTKEYLEQKLIQILDINNDILGIYNLAKTKGHKLFLDLIESGHGRILRSSTTWEDAVKTLCTTNASWGFTKIMCKNLCALYGNEGSFPSPFIISELDENELKQNAILGYRSKYIIELARRIKNQELNLEVYQASTSNIDTARKAIKNIKGFGPYASNHLLVMLRWYSFLPIDREVMKFLGIKQKNINSKCPEYTDYYKEWGEYKYIAYKLDRISKKLNWIGE